MTNVPNTISESDFKQWIEKQSIQPLSFTFHNAGSPPTFTGIVFIQYRNIEDAGISWGYLKESILSGIPMNVEYKKRTDRREFDPCNAPVFLSTIAQQIWTQVITFKSKFVQKNSGTVPSLVFPHDLSP